jgi:hypothetical protein
MMYKSLVTGTVALLAAFALQPAAAKADTQIGIVVGGGWQPAQYDSGYPVYHPGYPDYDDEDDYDDQDYISCWEGRRIVRQYGFREVRPTRCSGEVYRYRAVKRYRLWSIRVSARSGRIIDAHVIGRYGYY